VFFGYYDVTPFSGDGTRLLATRGPRSDGPPSGDTVVDVGVYDLRTEHAEFVALGDSSTWCWQQGCRLQWYPHGNNHTILYNCLVEGRYGCVIRDVRRREIVKAFRRPVYCVTRDGTWGFSLGFSRLQRIRPGYGYVNLPDDTQGDLAPRNEGIWRVDMRTGKEELLFSVAEVASLEPLETMTGAEHYFNHILCNPGGTRFLFFHLWVHKGVRFSRLITCDIDGGHRYVLVNEGHVSHYTWKSNSEILAYSTHADTGTRFYLYRDRSRVRSTVGEGLLSQDGHPSYSPDGSLLLVDTYPDRLREQQVLVYRCQRSAVERIGAFFSPMKFLTTDVRCDLHPRWSHCGRYICLDSACDGKRAMYVLDLEDMV
jgi:hypothetical protein